jgi:hypothetical protein
MPHRIRIAVLSVAIASVIAFAGVRPSAAQEQEGELAKARSSAGGRFFEMRTYHTAEGKLEALHERFRNHTNRLFRKHGIEIVAYWTPADDPAAKDTLVFILAYPSREAREKSWQGFTNDPEWKKAAAESEKDGKLVTKVDQLFMNPTDYSPIK